MLQRTRANSRAPNVLMLVAEGLGYVPACGGLTRAAQQAMEVAQVECGFFLVGWSFFVLYMQTVERGNFHSPPPPSLLHFHPLLLQTPWSCSTIKYNCCKWLFCYIMWSQKPFESYFAVNLPLNPHVLSFHSNTYNFKQTSEQTWWKWPESLISQFYTGVTP